MKSYKSVPNFRSVFLEGRIYRKQVGAYCLPRVCVIQMTLCNNSSFMILSLTALPLIILRVGWMEFFFTVGGGVLLKYFLEGVGEPICAFQSVVGFLINNFYMQGLSLWLPTSTAAHFQRYARRI